MNRKRSNGEGDAHEANLDERERWFLEVAQRAVDDLNARRAPGTPPWPDRVPPPGKGSTRAEREAWEAQLEDNGRRLRELAEKGWAELQAKKRAAGL